MSDSNEVVTDPRLNKPTRSRFSIAEKKRLLAGSPVENLAIRVTRRSSA